MTRAKRRSHKAKVLSCTQAMSKNRFLHDKTSIGSVVHLRRFYLTQGLVDQAGLFIASRIEGLRID